MKIYIRKREWFVVLNVVVGVYKMRIEMIMGLVIWRLLAILICIKFDWSSFKRGGFKGVLL